MNFTCQFPLWNDGHVSTCFQDKYLGTFIPLATCLVSLGLYALSDLSYHRGQRAGFEPVLSSDELVLDPQHVTTISPRIEILETTGITLDIVVGIILLATGTGDRTLAITSELFSAYLLLLLITRKSNNRLQSHSGILYSIQWLCTALIGQAMLVEDSGGFVRSATLFRLAIFTGLFSFHLTAPRVLAKTPSSEDDPLEPGREETASLLSRLTFFWVNELVWKAFRATLEATDLYHLDLSLQSATITIKFHEFADHTFPLLWRMYHLIKHDFIKQGAWATVTSVAVFMPAMLIKYLLEYLESPGSTPRSTAWLYAAGLLLSGVTAGVADSQCNWIGRKISAKLRAALVKEIYAKVLRKRMEFSKIRPDSEHTRGPASDGNIFNLMSSDAETVSWISGGLYLVWITFPVQTTIGTFVLYRILGISGAVGVIVMIALLPLNLLLSKHVAVVQRHLLSATDARVQASNELLDNIRTIKYCAWEVPFKERLLGRRRSEMRKMRSRFIWWSISMTVFHSLPFVVTILTCFFYTVVWGNQLGTAVAFPALAAFTVLRIPLDRMADSINFILQAHVSLLRIQSFFNEQETSKYAQVSGTEMSLIGFDNVTLAWPSSGFTNPSEEVSLLHAENSPSPPYTLHDLQVSFQKDGLNVICGPSGSGKSMLLLGLLGEMDIVRGQVLFPREEIVDNTIPSLAPTGSNSLCAAAAYCPQEPWIMNRTIRENIQLGFPFNAPRYQEVLHAVALLQDLAELGQGDKTFAGENGSRLSGGQKQRVALARALYSPCRVVLLDDCLSAVDHHTANHIFFNAIKGSLMQGRTCILTTHNTKLTIPHCDFVVLLDDGRIKGQGTAKSLASAGLISADIIESKVEQPLTSFDVTPSQRSSLSLEYVHIDFNGGDPEIGLDYKESKAEGIVSWSVVQTYLTTMGPMRYWVIVLIGFAAQQLASLGANLWIKEWSFQYDKIEKEAMSEIESEKVSARYYLTVYCMICLSYALISFLRDLVTFHGSLEASSRIYERLLNSVLHAKLLFFDRVPLGQITNRFSKDVQILDQSLAGFSISAFQLAGSIAMVVILISVVLPAFLPVAIIICVAYYYVMAVYINGARDLKRIKAVQRSPLYQQFGETLSGFISIRAYARTSIFIAQNSVLIDRLNQPYLLLGATKEWLTVRIDILSSVISFTTAAFILWNMDFIDPGIAGLVLTYAATFTENAMWFVQVCAIIQQNLNSVERILEYCKLEQEAVEPLRNAVYDLPDDWPSQGGIRFQNYSTRYAPELELSLKDIDLEIRPRQRTAIVGRTGAGKSTLALALIRGLEAEIGHIDIDGIDISSVTLQRLRQVVTVVPQDPKLFDGNLRDNLDPLNIYDDEELLSKLRTVHLLDFVKDRSFNSPLDYAADALSRGQRQLLCIARALLRRSPVLVLDEVTASIDHPTDAAVQAGLRASVAVGTTIITVAHRLRTIADYDRIVVFDSGRVVEKGSVQELLGRQGDDAVFRRLCEESGDMEAIERAAAFHA